MPSRVVKALDTGKVSELTGVPVSTLNQWVQARLCRPSYLGPSGQRVNRYWHPRDVVVVRTIRALRNAGCDMKLVRRVNKLIDEEWVAGTGRTLLYDGNDLYFVDDLDTRLMSGGREPGQTLFPVSISVAAIPVSLWISNVRDIGEEVDIAEQRQLRRKRLAARQRAALTRSFRNDTGS